MIDFIDIDNLILAKDRILVKIPPREKRIGSVLLPQDTIEFEQFSSCVGILVKVGCEAFEKLLDNSKPKIGDTIIFSPHCGTRFYDEKEIKLLKLDRNLYSNMLCEDYFGFISKNNNKQ